MFSFSNKVEISFDEVKKLLSDLEMPFDDKEEDIFKIREVSNRNFYEKDTTVSSTQTIACNLNSLIINQKI